MKQQSIHKPRQDFCKNHNEVPSGYLLINQPWIKYCKACALNVALCGKKIEKIYSCNEIQRKLTIESVSAEMKECLEEGKDNELCYNKLLEMMDENAKIMVEKIKEVSNAIRDLTNSKKQLEQLYSEQIERKIAIYSQRQNSLFMCWIELKRELQNIQSRYTSFLQQYQEQQFIRCEEGWNTMIVNFKRQIIRQEEYSQIRSEMWEAVQSFYHQYQVLTKLKLLPTRQETLITEHQFDFTLTPVTNNLASYSQPEENKFTRSKNQLKLRCNRRVDKQETITTKLSSKKQSWISHEGSQTKQNVK